METVVVVLNIETKGAKAAVALQSRSGHNSSKNETLGNSGIYRQGKAAKATPFTASEK